MQVNDFLTLDYIATFVGTVVVTMLLVQFLKDLPLIKKIPTKYFTFIVALVNILICTATFGTFTLQSVYLVFINAVVITFTCTGGYDFTYKKVKVTEQASEDKIPEVEVGNINFKEEK